MEFEQFELLFQKQFDRLIDGQDALFVTAVDREALWVKYLESFPPGTNEIFRERREYDCSCCNHFIRAFGNVVAIRDNRLVSLWDFDPGDQFSPVMAALSEMVKAAPVQDVHVSKQALLGTAVSRELLESGGVRAWHHFHLVLPSRFVSNSHKSESAIAAVYRDTRNVFKRSLDELSRSAVQTVLDLIAEKTLYRGEEWEAVLSEFLTLHDEYHALPADEQENYAWVKSVELGGAVGRIRNHSIGVLLQDLTAGAELEEAVRRYEVIVAPTNYKRPKPIFTAKMVEQAQEAVERLGLLDSLGRRHAQLADITINNVLWANRKAARRMDGVGEVFVALKQEAAVNPNKFKDLPGISIDHFLKEVLYGAHSLEVLLENRHQPNLMSLIAPQVADSPTLFKWSNGFSWAYNGNIADSMKQRVKAAGGNVTGVLRFSLQWNTEGDNPNDYDAHCREPNGFLIFFGDKRDRSTSGSLDVDIIHPSPSQVAVENITWTHQDWMPEGEYAFYVHTYSHRGGRSGFDAEVEFNGQVFEFAYHKDLPHGNKVLVARVRYSKRDGFKLIESLPTTTSTRTVWGLQTNQFQPVSVVMFSPNDWDGQQGVGNKHHFFMLAGCQNDTQPNGFFNEYLREAFTPHRKVFEALGSKMRVDPAEDQLSGLGFSSTKRDSLIVKVDGRPAKIIF